MEHVFQHWVWNYLDLYETVLMHVWTHSHRFKEQKGKKIITQVTHEPSFSVYSVTMLNSSYIHVPLLVRRP